MPRLTTAELQYQERRNVKIIQQAAGSTQNPYLLSEQDEKSTVEKHVENKKKLRVPRRPPWTKSMTSLELDKQEKAAFLDWRRGLATYVVSLLSRKSILIPLGFKMKTNCFSLRSKRIWKYGVNCGVCLNALILLFKSLTHVTHYVFAVKIWKDMCEILKAWRVKKELEMEIEKGSIFC